MNYQLLMESYSFRTDLSEQEIELLSLEIDEINRNQIVKMLEHKSK